MITLRNKKGFTLVETLVAVTILITAVTGPMVLAASSIRATRDARNELIATHLAEEGIEILHNIRDNNVTNYPLTATSWIENILFVCRTTGCISDVTAQDSSLVWSPTALFSCITANCAGDESIVYYNPTTGLYRQSAIALTSPWVISPFRRHLLIIPVNNPSLEQRQIRIESTVTFVGYGGVTKSVKINDDLYNWFPPLK